MKFDRLFITEKPELRDAICDALGGGFHRHQGYYTKDSVAVVNCFGHMLKLCDPHDYDERYKKWSLNDLPFHFLPPQKKPDPKRKTQLNVILGLIKQASEIVNVGDPDDEGQLLVDEIIQYSKVANVPVKRVLINDVNTKVVKRALANMQDNKDFEHMGWKAEARSVADQTYGYNLTRAYTLKAQEKGNDGVLSIGRVQTPILGLIVRRDREHHNHVESYFYNIYAKASENNTAFRLKMKPLKSEDVFQGQALDVDDKGRLLDENQAKTIVTHCLSSAINITDFKTVKKAEKPPLLYNILKLQQQAARKFGYSMEKTLDITQRLREKYKLITYNRSDSQYLNMEHHADAPNVLAAVQATAPIFEKVIAKTDTTIKSRVFNDKNVTAHHAIIPTEATADIDKLAQDEKNIYLLIARSYIAQFYPDYTFYQTTIEADIGGFQFKATSKKEDSLGWKSLFTNDKGNKEVEQSPEDGEIDDVDLSVLSKDSSIKNEGVYSDMGITEPPQLYTEASLAEDFTRVAKYVKNKELAQVLRDKDKDKKGEHGGIGTGATRHKIVETLFDRGYIERKGKKIVSTKLGQNLYDQLSDLLRYPDMTAIWHQQQQNILTGADAYGFVKKMMQDVVTPEVTRIKGATVQVSEPATIHHCKKCTRPLKRLRGSQKGSFFWGCTGYSDKVNPCKQTYPDKKGVPNFDIGATKKAFEMTEYECKKCSDGKLIKRPQKKDKTKFWYGCSNFKKGCKQTYFEKDGKPDYGTN